METRPDAAGNHACGDAAAQVDRELVDDRPAAAVRVRGSDDVVLGDDPAFRFVAVQQRVVGPALQHPRELPAEVVTALQRGVHTGAAARRHAVGGVAGEERAAGTEPVRELARRVERTDALDARVEVGAGTLAYQRRDARFAELRHPFDVLGCGGAVHPSVVGTGGEEQTRRARRRHDVQRVPEFAEELPQRRAEHHLHSAVHPCPLLHRDAEQSPRRAVRAIRADEVAGAHTARVAGCVAQRRAHPVGTIVHGNELRSELEAHRRQRCDVATQHRLEPVLRHCARRGRTDHGRLLATRIANRVRVPLGGECEGRALPEPHVGVDAAREDLVLEVPGAQQLHRASADHRRAGQRRRLDAPLDEQRRHVVATECGGRGEPGGARAHDDDVAFEVGRVVFHEGLRARGTVRHNSM